VRCGSPAPRIVRFALPVALSVDCLRREEYYDTMSKKTQTHTLNRIRRPDDISDENEHLDDLAQDERIRRQSRDTNAPGDAKQQRRQRQKEWGRTVNRSLRKQRRDGSSKP
jgi:hypothetical protein